MTSLDCSRKVQKRQELMPYLLPADGQTQSRRSSGEAVCHHDWCSWHSEIMPRLHCTSVTIGDKQPLALWVVFLAESLCKPSRFRQGSSLKVDADFAMMGGDSLQPYARGTPRDIEQKQLMLANPLRKQMAR